MRLKVRVSLASTLPFAVGFFVCLGSLNAVGQAPPSRAATSDAVVQRLVEHDQNRADQLRSYTSRREYRLVYHGFPHSLEATMEVEADCSGPTKSFRIISQSGSQLLVNHVLKKLLTSEQEAAAEQNRNALTPSNYSFSLVGSGNEDGRQVYVFDVHPRTRNKFLYRGTIWVDGEDYAVVRVQAEPAENPSFWIRNTEIHHQYFKLGEFWLPRKNTTVTKVRFGGTATLTIDYQDYSLDAAMAGSPKASSPESSIVSHAMMHSPPVRSLQKIIWDAAVSLAAAVRGRS